MFYHFYIKISQFLIYVLHYALFILQNTINHPSYILFRHTGGLVNGKAERSYSSVVFTMPVSLSFYIRVDLTMWQSQRFPYWYE